MKKLTLLLSSFLFLVAACTPQETATPTPVSTEPQTLTVMTHDSFAVSEDVVKAFEESNNARLVFLQSGDAGARYYIARPILGRSYRAALTYRF